MDELHRLKTPRPALAPNIFLFLASLLLLPGRRLAMANQTVQGASPGFTGWTTFDNCNTTQQSLLKQAADDAVTIATAGLEIYPSSRCAGEFLAPNERPAGCYYMDWKSQAAIDYWGPESVNKDVQTQIYNTVMKARLAYPGWGLEDWWKNNYVSVGCEDHSNRVADCWNATSQQPTNFAAFFSSGDHSFNYPRVFFCDNFFDRLPSHADAVKKIGNDLAKQQNLANLRSQATTFMHELLHINWGVAQECFQDPNGGDCVDQIQLIGPSMDKKIASYKPGRAKMLAGRDVQKAAWNNDNYAYYSTAKWAQKQFGTYPKYPSTWNASRNQSDNQDRENNEPGYPPAVPLWETQYDEMLDTQAQEDPTKLEWDLPYYQYDPNNLTLWYPDWYTPLFTVNFGDQQPDLNPPTDQPVNYLGPDPSNITCSSSLPSDLNDCGSTISALQGPDYAGKTVTKGQAGKELWLGLNTATCKMSLHYDSNWDDNCQFTYDDLADYLWAITMTCRPDNSNLVDLPARTGGSVNITMDNCPGQVAIIDPDTVPQPPPNGTN